MHSAECCSGMKLLQGKEPPWTGAVLPQCPGTRVSTWDLQLLERPLTATYLQLLLCPGCLLADGMPHFRAWSAEGKHLSSVHSSHPLLDITQLCACTSPAPSCPCISQPHHLLPLPRACCPPVGSGYAVPSCTAAGNGSYGGWNELRPAPKQLSRQSLKMLSVTQTKGRWDRWEGVLGFPALGTAPIRAAVLTCEVHLLSFGEHLVAAHAAGAGGVVVLPTRLQGNSLSGAGPGHAQGQNLRESNTK